MEKQSTKKLRKIADVNYSKGIVPIDYKCDNCLAHGIKLWRKSHTYADTTKLLCANCTEEDQKKSHKDGWQSSFKRGEGDQIGWFVPAVPIQGDDTYWGYCSVPDNGVEWWLSLPVKIKIN